MLYVFLPDDLNSAQVKSPLDDSSLSSSFMILMYYAPASTAWGTSYICATSGILQRHFGEYFMIVDVVPYIQVSNETNCDQIR